MSSQDIVSIGTALGAALLALFPVYSKWREIRREQALADHETGVDSFQHTVQSAVAATFASQESRFIMVLSLLILAGLIHNAWRAVHYSGIIDSHYSEFRKLRDLVLERHGEMKAQRAEFLDILHRIEGKVQHLKP